MTEPIVFVSPSNPHWRMIREQYGVDEDVVDHVIIVQPPNEPPDGLKRIGFCVAFKENGMAARFLAEYCRVCGYTFRSVDDVLQRLGMGVIASNAIYNCVCIGCWKPVVKDDYFHTAEPDGIVLN